MDRPANLFFAARKVSPGNVVIRAEGIGKRYRIGARRASHGSLRDSVASAARRMATAPFRAAARLVGRPSREDEFIWALKGVSFEVDRGEVVGVIGPNGAGKTTLLKVLSRITEPTEGRAEIRGRVGSLLEVGTGFHPDLTGRENVYLNGAILGMKRREIRAKFDEIVAFAEVDRFIDTPIKRYSAGMHTRLAFAVAAHLEPEILLVDEVLAVGDAAFQKKCLGKMGDVAARGRTVLFVSHNMAAITRICEKAILMDKGRLVLSDLSHRVVRAYLRQDRASPAERVWDGFDGAPGDDSVRLKAVRARDEAGHAVESVDIRKPVGIDIEYWNLKPGKRLVPNVHVFNEEGVCVFISTNNSDERWYNQPHPTGLFKSTCWIPGNFLSESCFTVLAAVSTVNPTKACAAMRDAVSFLVVDRSEGDGARGELASDFPGVVRPLLKWTMEHEPLGPEGMPGPAGRGSGEDSA